MDCNHDIPNGHPDQSESGSGIAPLDVVEFRKHAHAMVDFIADYYRDVEQHPVCSVVEPGYLAPLLPDHAPEEPEPLEAILSDVREKIIPGVTHWQSPNFFAYFPANSSTAGFIGDMLATGLNVVGFSWISSPACTELETIALDWLGRLLKLPKAFLSGGKGGGVIQGTASEATLVALLTARQQVVDRRRTDGSSTGEAAPLGKLVAYWSDQAHSSMQKAAMIAGLEPANFRCLPTTREDSYTLNPTVLQQAVQEDKSKGLIPFFVLACVGTTSSCAVDSLSSIGQVAAAEGLYMHVDAAYAGPACMLPELNCHLEGVELADSFNCNAHKWMLCNFDCSCLWVKDSKPLLNALSITPEFLRNKATESGAVVDYKDWQIPLGRKFRALKLWMVMRMYGTKGLFRYFRQHIALAKGFEELVSADDRFEVLAPVNFGLVCFRLKPLAGDSDNGWQLNVALEERVNATGKLFITHTSLSGVYTLRLAVGNPRTSEQHIVAAWRIIQVEAAQLLKKT